MVFQRNGLFGGQVASTGGDTNFLGNFATPAELMSEHPTADLGNEAFVNSTDTFWRWDGSAWADTGVGRGITASNPTAGAIPMFDAQGNLMDSIAVTSTDVENQPTITFSGNVRAGTIRTSGDSFELGEQLIFSDGGGELLGRNRLLDTTSLAMFRRYSFEDGTDPAYVGTNLTPFSFVNFSPDTSGVTMVIPVGGQIEASFTNQITALLQGERFRANQGKMRFDILAEVPSDLGTFQLVFNGNDSLPRDVDFDNPTTTSGYAGGDEDEIIPLHPVTLTENQNIRIRFRNVGTTPITIKGNTTASNDGNFIPFFDTFFSTKTFDSFLPIDDTATDNEHTYSAQRILELVNVPVFDEPQVTSLSIQGQATEVERGTTLTGSQVFNYSVSHTGNVQGDLTLEQDGETLASNISPTGTTATETVTDVTLTAGQVVTFRLSGTDTQSNTFDRTTTVSAPLQLYWNDKDTNTPTDFDFENALNTNVSDGTQAIVVPTFTGSQYLAIAQPDSTADITALLIGNVNQVAGFTKTENAFSIDTVSYDIFISNNELFGSVISGETITIQRG